MTGPSKLATVAKLITVALVSIALLAACVPSSHARTQHAAADRPTLSFVFQNLSSQRVSVYLVEPTAETLLGRVRPMESNRLAVPEQTFMRGEATLTLAIVRGRATTSRPSLEAGAILSVPVRGAAIIGRTWAFTGEYLYQPTR
jgi:hypothetical protein